MCRYDSEHANRVTYLTLRLFDLLADLHGFGKLERFWLHCASILHDIGLVEGKREHHKTSQRMILTTSLLPFGNQERLIIGSIARYHRRTLPNLSHDHYASLSVDERQMVSKLAALLRLSVGMVAQFNGVPVVSCEIKRRKVTVLCAIDGSLPNSGGTLAQADLFEWAYGKMLTLQWGMKGETS